MADNQLFNDGDDDGVGGDEDIFVYTGGEQEVPRDVKRVRIAENIDTVPAGTFSGCRQLIEVVGHNRLKKIEASAFHQCRRLRRLSKMTGVIEIEEYAFFNCTALSEFDFDKLEIIGEGALGHCYSLRSINLPSVRSVGNSVFQRCHALTDAAFGEKLDRIERSALAGCRALRRIVIPFKDNLLFDEFAFNNCDNLSTVDILDGGIHRTISSLHMESWRDEMEGEINSINQTLPNIGALGKTGAIQQWIERVHQRMEHFKRKHHILLKEAMALLELALWKAKLLHEKDENEKKCNVEKKAKIDTESARKEHRVTCGASIVIKNVLPFLALK